MVRQAVRSSKSDESPSWLAQEKGRLASRPVDTLCISA